MSKEQQYIAFNKVTDAVEAIGTQSEVLSKLSEDYGMAQLDQLEVYPIGQKLTVNMVLIFPPEPPL